MICLGFPSNEAYRSREECWLLGLGEGRNGELLLSMARREIAKDLLCKALSKGINSILYK